MKEPTAGHVKAIRERGDAFEQFRRNGMWGSCMDCPRDSNGRAYPEFCEFAARTEHKRTLEDLLETYHNHARGAD